MLDGLLKLFGYERRSDARLYGPGWDVPRNIISSGYVSPQNVLSHSADAARAIELKATMLASVPFDVFQRSEDGGRVRLRDHALARLLERPNGYQTRFELIELVSRSLDMWGNAFLEIERSADGEPIALHPLPPHTVQVERLTSGRLRYKVGGTTDRESRVLLDSEMVHIKNATDDGAFGVSPIIRSRSVFALAIQTLEAATRMMEQGSIAGYVIKHPGKLGATAIKNVRESIREAGGITNAGVPLVFEEGMEPVPLGQSAEDSQFKDSRRLLAEEVAKALGVPPAALGLSDTVSYGSAAQAHLDLCSTTLSPLAARIEAAFERALSPPGSGIFFEFAIQGLLRADPGQRWQTYDIGRRTGALSPNDIRRLENLPPRDGGDEYGSTQSVGGATP